MTSQSAHPFHLLIKPVGAKCNLDCHYCYYLRKQERYQDGATMQMSEQMLESYIAGYIAAQPDDCQQLDFSWQGGEPALRGLPFYQKAVELQQHYGRDKMKITNTFQTNGTLINEKWAAFFQRHQFLVGISIDGDELNHGHGRPTLKGENSFDKVIRGLELLKQYQVSFNTLTVVHSDNADQGRQTYQTLKDLGSTVIQFQPCVEHPDDQRSDKDWSLSADQWGSFLCDVFDEWKENDVGKVHIQFFENTLSILAGQPSQMCFHSEFCGQQLMLEHDGSIYSCDHFSYDDYRVGDIDGDDLGLIASSERQRKFGTDKWASLPQQCKRCHFRPFCNGGCPKDRTAVSVDLENGLNRLCAGYKQFFIHAMPTLGAILETVQQGYPANLYSVISRLKKTSQPGGNSPHRIA
ncbi:Anaerobic sulfatase-maturating enzyme [Sinobacterium norvegicum]|uniref:Anaerobic sulfatase-maturating enzyme n=1 Tax=Sinobacterium norvegicum TaxID=1641715 RepID=A0ABN8EGH5_9GAMM|nr:anaerobic sulfatase maturase [Sinobacterium norvegicum]CAH0991114.1 Anaerobic sulfatase-maturating enzyme [Sinobacterium norvegicum]